MFFGLSDPIEGIFVILVDCIALGEKILSKLEVMLFVLIFVFGGDLENSSAVWVAGFF